jgi:hypothetical protein
MMYLHHKILSLQVITFRLMMVCNASNAMYLNSKGVSGVSSLVALSQRLRRRRAGGRRRARSVAPGRRQAKSPQSGYRLKNFKISKTRAQWLAGCRTGDVTGIIGGMPLARFGNVSDGAGHNGRSDNYMQYLRARKAMEVRKEAERFRVGSKVRLLERRALALEKYIASISLVSILFAILIQEITFNGSYSNEYGGDWFSKKQQVPIPASKMIATEDSPIVTMMKFFLTKLTIVQLCMMITQFRISLESW